MAMNVTEQVCGLLLVITYYHTVVFLPYCSSITIHLPRSISRPVQYQVVSNNMVHGAITVKQAGSTWQWPWITWYICSCALATALANVV